MSGFCVSGSLSDEQKGRLLQRFKVLCVAGLQTEGNQTDGESTLIRCNCCYNLPVHTETHTQQSFELLSSRQIKSLPAVSLSRPW